jgi:hypothetical protein
MKAFIPNIPKNKVLSSIKKVDKIYQPSPLNQSILSI